MRISNVLLLLGAAIVAVHGVSETAVGDSDRLGACTYTVVSGDSLSAIANKFPGNTWQQIAAANGIGSPYTIYVGQRLTIPNCGSPSPSPPSGSCVHTVVSGDTLSGIGDKYGVSWLSIAQANGIGSPYTIYVGQRLTIPGCNPTPSPTPGTSCTYTVMSGDTLSGIALKFPGNTWQQIAAANGIVSPYTIHVGQRLTIPNCNNPTPGPGPAPAPGGDTGGGIPAWNPYGSACTTPYSARRGFCMAVNDCTGGTFNNLCGGSSKCCVQETRASARTKALISPSVFAAAFNGIGGARVNALHPYFNEALHTGQINTCMRISAFIGQLAHESVGLIYFEEIADGSAYEGRADLGNIYPGDGKRYKGRGPIQLTGRSNYRSFGNWLGYNTENDPESVGTPSHGFKAAVWFWTSRGLNALADVGDYRTITLRINGGYNGWDDRLRRYNQIRAMLGC